MISKLILAIFLLGISMQSSAQSGRQVLKHLSTKDGLSSNEVRKVLEDSYGFIWFATSDGLCRWDGYEFKVFKNYNNDSNSLPNYFLLCLEEDTSKNIWIGTNHGGLARYNTVEDRFYRYSSIQDDENSIPGMVVRCVFKDSKQNIWIGTHSGLAKYNPESDNFTRFSVSGDKIEVSNDIRQIFQISNSELIIQSDAGFFRLDTERNLISRFEFNLQGVDQKIFLQNNPACFDSKGNLWIGSPEGLFRLDLVNGNFRKYLPDANKSNCINSVNFSVIFEDSRSNVWIGTENRGLNIYNRESDDFTHLEAGLSKNNLSNNIISDIYEDKHSTLWISTLEGGVNYFSFKKAMFEHFFHDPFDKNSLSGNRIAAFCEDDSGFIWIGAEDGGLNKYSAKDNSFTRYHLNSEFIAPSIMSIEKHAQNEFFISGLRIGLYNFDSKTGKFSNLMWRENSSSLRSGMQITDLLTDSKGLLWMSTHDKEGIMIYNPDLKQYYSAVNPGSFTKDVLGIPYAVCFLEDSKQRMWIASYLGLYMFDNELHTILSDNKKKYTPGSNYHYTIFEDAGKNLWLGNSKGLDKILENGDSFSIERYSEKFSLPQNIKGILEDSNGNLWLSSNLGITRFNPQTKQSRNYKFNKELENPEFSERVCFKSKSGDMYFGGINGFLRFNPDSLENELTPSKILLTDFQLFNVSQSVGDNSVLEKSIIDSKKIVLKYNESVLGFQYVALDFNHSGVIEYAYMMDGFDKSWNFVGEKRFASYTNLSPGSYTFRVCQAKDMELIDGSETNISIIINPPYWRTIWAYGIYGILLMLILFLFRRAIISREKMKAELQLEKNKIDSAREADLMKLRFFTNVSHEFKTPLTLIKAPIEKLISSQKTIKKEEQNFLYELIQNNSEKLLRMVNQLLDYRKLEAGGLVFEASEGDFIDFCKKTWSVFELLARKKNIKFSFITALNSEIMLFDADKIEKILSNLLSNALKFTPDGGEVTLSLNKVIVEKNPNKASISVLEIQVSDTGIGIPESDLGKIFERFYTVTRKGDKKYEGTGIGLTLVKEFTELHKGEVIVKSKEFKGTEFIVRIPILRKELIQVHTDFEEPESIKDENIDYQIINKEEIQVFHNKQTGKKRRILLVEDDNDLRKFLKNELIVDYEVFEASDGIEGWESALLHNPHLIVSDIMMPKFNGMELCRKIKTDERTSHVPVILLTAMHSQEKQIEGLDTGADDYIFKPFNVAVIKSRITNLLNSRDKLSKKFNDSHSLDFEHENHNDRDNKLIQFVIDIVLENITNEKINADFIAHKLHISRSLLYIKIEAITGESVNEFVRNIRLKKSTSLLRNKNYSISEVAFAVGFSSQSYFTRCFTGKYGKSPREMQDERE